MSLVSEIRRSKTFVLMSQLIKRLPVPLSHLVVLVLGLYFLVHRPSILAGIVVVLLVSLLYRHYGQKVTVRLLPVLCGFSLVFVFQEWQSNQASQSIPERVSTVQLVPDTLRINGDRLSFQGRDRHQTYQLFYRLQSEEEKQYFQRVHQPILVTFEGELQAPEGQRNFNGFDYREYLQTKGIYRTIQVKDIMDLSQSTSFNPLLWLSSLRRKAIVHIKETFPAPMEHYMTGLLLGELDTDFAEMSDVYSSLGIIHLFALSGMQVGFFIELFRWLLLRLGLQRETVDKWQVPFSFFYAGMTGFSISVVRSLVQKGVGRLGLRGLDNLALTALGCMVCVPSVFLSAGGVLSFVYALILTVVEEEEASVFQRWLKESLVLSLGVLPFLTLYFYEFQLFSIPLTAVFSLLFDSLLLPLLTVIFLLSPFLPVIQVNVLFVWLEKIMIGLLDWTPSSWVLGKPSPLVLLGIVFVLALAYEYRTVLKKTLFCLAMAALLFFMVKHPLENEVTIVDVGQGDSIFLRDITGKTVLIDVGGRVSFVPKEEWQQGHTEANARRTLIPYLKSRGVNRIDQLVLTHTDTDHIGDMEVVASEFAVGEVLVSQGSLTDKEFVHRLKAMKVRVRVLTAGDSLPIMGSHLQVLYPWQTGDGGNNDSLVLYGKLLGTNFLFTGDLEEGELELVERYPDLPVDVLKAGHHGSKGSSYPEFLEQIQAKIALISAGKNNRYQHPHRETLERFADQGMTVYRTDQQGAIRFRGWRQWQAETVRP